MKLATVTGDNALTDRFSQLRDGDATGIRKSTQPPHYKRWISAATGNQRLAAALID
jgi:hypothetical protein